MLPLSFCWVNPEAKTLETIHKNRDFQVFLLDEEGMWFVFRSNSWLEEAGIIPLVVATLAASVFEPGWYVLNGSLMDTNTPMSPIYFDDWEELKVFLIQSPWSDRMKVFETRKNLIKQYSRWG